MTTGKHLPRFCGRIVLAACAIVFALLLGWREWSLQPDGRLHLHFLDVGQGDAALVVLPFGTTIVIDGGPDWSALSAIGSRTPFFRRRIDLLVLTHPHLDHVASLPELVKRYDVGMVLLARTPYASGRYAAFANAMQERGVPVTDIRQRHIQLESGAVLDVLWPPPGAVGLAVKDVNAASVVAKLRVRGHAVLFTGDAEKTAERALLAAGADLRAEVLKVGHHGSRDSSTPAFLAAVGAKTAIISSGTGNTYGHPHSETLARLASMEARVLRTDTLGTISLVLN